MDPGRIESKGSETNPNLFRKVSQGLIIVNMGKLIIGDPNSPPTNDLKKGYAHESVKIMDKSTRFGERTPFCLEVPVVPNLHSATGLTVYQGNTKAMTIYQGNTPKIQ